VVPAAATALQALPEDGGNGRHTQSSNLSVTVTCALLLPAGGAGQGRQQEQPRQGNDALPRTHRQVRGAGKCVGRSGQKLAN
jgi:hypothetical protein